MACSILLAMVGSSLASAAGQCKLGKLAELPISMRGARALTTAGINGDDVQLTVDSGAFYSTLTPSSAAALKLKTSALPFGFSVRGMGGGTAEVTYANVKTLTIFGRDLHNIGFLVGGSEIGAGSAGLLGRNLLHLGDVEYDLAHGFIRLFEAKDCSQTSLAYWGGAYSEIPIVPRQDFPDSTTGSMRIPRAPWMFTNISRASVNGVEVRFLLDTGSLVSFISLKAAAQAGITPDSPGVVYAGDFHGAGRTEFRTYIARFDSFKIGEEEIKNAKLRIADIELPGIDMILGADFVLSHRIYVANSQRRMYFSFNGGPVFDLSINPRPTTEAAMQTPPTPPATAATSTEDAADFARRGEAFESRHDFDQALAALNRACELAPDNAEYLFRRGLIHVELRQLEPARSDFDQSLQLRPNDLNTLLTRAELRIRSGDTAGGRADLDAADAVAPRQANEHFRMALAYERADQLDMAISQLGLWIDSHDRDALLPIVLNERCWVRALEGTQLPLALKDCTSALRLTDKSAAVYARIANSRGLVYLRMGDFDRSVADYTTAVKLNPKDAWSWYGRGIDNLKKHKTQEGHADIAQALALWPKVAEEFRRRGIADPSTL